MQQRSLLPWLAGPYEIRFTTSPHTRWQESWVTIHYSMTKNFVNCQAGCPSVILRYI
jgi:hypothetical protein